MSGKRKTPRQPVVSIYLGSQEKRIERLAKLDAIATQLGVSRSVLIQKIADGEFIVLKSVDLEKKHD